MRAGCRRNIVLFGDRTADGLLPVMGAIHSGCWPLNALRSLVVKRVLVGCITIQSERGCLQGNSCQIRVMGFL